MPEVLCKPSSCYGRQTAADCLKPFRITGSSSVICNCPKNKNTLMKDLKRQLKAKTLGKMYSSAMCHQGTGVPEKAVGNYRM